MECSFKFAPFACTQRRKPQPDEEEEDLSSQLTRALSMCVRIEKYPKSTIDVFCLVLQDDGAWQSTAFHPLLQMHRHSAAQTICAAMRSLAHNAQAVLYRRPYAPALWRSAMPVLSASISSPPVRRCVGLCTLLILPTHDKILTAHLSIHDTDGTHTLRCALRAGRSWTPLLPRRRMRP